jgi:hypothetical protein
VRLLAGEDQQPLQVVDTLVGRMHVRWDEGAAATPHGQLVFFAEFPAATGVFERWVSSCPLQYRSGNAPDKRDVLGTLMLGLLEHRSPGRHRAAAHPRRHCALARLSQFRPDTATKASSNNNLNTHGMRRTRCGLMR